MSLYTIPEYFYYPFRDFLVSWTLCIASTFDLDDTIEEQQQEKLILNGKNFNESISMRSPSDLFEYDPNPIKERDKLKIDIVEENTNEEDNEENKSFTSQKQIINYQDNLITEFEASKNDIE